MNLDIDPPRSTLTVIICAYTLDRWADIKAAVESLRAQTVPPTEVIMVSDYNSELCERAHREFPEVKVLANKSSRGLSGARNTGVDASTSHVIAFLDDDAAADTQWAERLLDAYTDPDVIGVGGRVVPEWRAARPAWLPEEYFWVIGCSYIGQPTSRAEVRNAIGANMSFRFDVFGEVGQFDPGVGRIGKDAAGCEETEFSIRARRGFPSSKIILEPSALCRHVVTAERVTRGYFRRRCRAEGRSKAIVSRLAGADAALESERMYVTKVLPRGVLRGLTELVRRDPSGGARAITIIEGLFITSLSYFSARISLILRQTRLGMRVSNSRRRGSID